MEKIFYKIINSVDFVWKTETTTNDPYKLQPHTFGHYVNNKRVFHPVIFESLSAFQQSEHLLTYKEISPSKINKEKCYYDPTIGLLHKNDYWNNFFALRHINCLDATVPVVFDDNPDQLDSISNINRESYLKLLACESGKKDEIYDCAFNYFKTLWNFDKHFAVTNLDTIEKFLPTLELQAVYLKVKNECDAFACIVFRPSWDPDHGLAVLLDLKTLEINLMED